MAICQLPAALLPAVLRNKEEFREDDCEVVARPKVSGISVSANRLERSVCVASQSESIRRNQATL